MTDERFNLVMSKLLDKLQATLGRKGVEYGSGRDRLHNFSVASALIGCSKLQAAWGMAVKHIVSVSDLVARDDLTTPMEMWDEKIGDALNYLILMYAIIQEDYEEVCDSPGVSGAVETAGGPKADNLFVSCRETDDRLRAQLGCPPYPRYGGRGYDSAGIR